MESVVTNRDRAFWHERRVFLTGHTGFKGSWLALWLQQLGANVTGYALAPPTHPSLFELAQLGEGMRSYIADIRDLHQLQAAIDVTQPEIVFHLAAQPLVRASYRDPLATFATNVQGTANLLEVLRSLDCLRVVVVVTTDKVYHNLEHAFPYRETDALGGHDPYSASKAAAELVVACYRDAFLAAQGVAVASARAGNVIGGGDWSEDRLIPDAVRAWSTDQVLQIRRPEAIRPWQHVLESIAAYLSLAQRLWERPALADAYNFGPYPHQAATVGQVIELARATYGRGEVAWGDGMHGPHEALWLTLEIAKARMHLGFEPRWSLRQAVERTLSWYRDLAAGKSARELCLADLTAFANPRAR